MEKIFVVAECNIFDSEIKMYKLTALDREEAFVYLGELLFGEDIWENNDYNGTKEEKVKSAVLDIDMSVEIFEI